MSLLAPETPNAPEWSSEPAWRLPKWVEPIVVTAILFGAMYLTRRRDYRVLGPRNSRRKSYLDSDPSLALSSDELLPHDLDDNTLDRIDVSSAHSLKRRHCCGFRVQTPNSSRYANNVHSRILQKFPFLMEMFYWIITYAFYRMTSTTSQKVFSGSNIWDIAQGHGLAVLSLEQLSWLSFLFPLKELDIQRWFMNGHQTALTVLNRAYALIHIPGTVGFIAWYYYFAPSHNIFAVTRRTMTLTNFLAFTTFIFYPCMPPRLLPKEYGFLDTVRHGDAQSVFMKGKYVNSLAAMPSMHFGYSFAIGCTLIYHSGILPFRSEKAEARKSTFWRVFYASVGILYPTFILVTIVATANHYFLDTVVAACFVIFSFFCNRVFYTFLPLEDWLLWLLKVDKPEPTTGDRYLRKESRTRASASV